LSFGKLRIMENILKSTIRNEIQSIMAENSNNTQPRVHSASSVAENTEKSDTTITKKRKTEGRMSNLLTKIRTNNTGRSQPDKITNKKLKKLQLKYERYDRANEIFRHVRVKDGGGPRFIDVTYGKPVTFREIRRRGEKLFFDLDKCNHFSESIDESLVHIADASGQKLDDTEDL